MLIESLAHPDNFDGLMPFST